MRNPFRYFNSSPEVIRLAVMMYIRYPLSLRQVEELLFERGIDICHETVRFWWNRFGPMFAAEIRKRRAHHRSYSNWRWHLDGRCQSKILNTWSGHRTAQIDPEKSRKSMATKSGSNVLAK
jgi:transposase-like protein